MLKWNKKSGVVPHVSIRTSPRAILRSGTLEEVKDVGFRFYVPIRTRLYVAHDPRQWYRKCTETARRSLYRDRHRVENGISKEKVTVADM